MKALLLAIAMLLPGVTHADEATWNLLKRGGQVVLVRHASTTPGVGDPEGMKLDDCSTQRNLSDEGRAEAKRLGDALRAHNIVVGEVLSSPWCRCRETARIAVGREGRTEAALGNLFGRREQEAKQVAQLKPLVARVPAQGNTIMFTHGSTVYALTGVQPAQGEMVVLTPQAGGGFKLAGRITVGN
ncbi:histidine phosphatase family protein [Ramlibacter albus]|uniref:Histidine phosphatase family protein n=1 Tax=Ramlibacter albus TaxID=2079448 RepID=A0A923MA04_9BURK|nr:histidine phosphatase family protein [Ramlibacter albus]MBC5766105.1 histidine phosphatase family protein [Ramlibacter albus]